MKQGDLAPDFTLPAQTGRPLRLSELVGKKPIVLYFYPKDYTPGCTIEAREFRDHYDDFAAEGAEVVGISGDSVASHRRFAASLDLPFTLLSDADGAVRKLYGVEKTLGLIPGRVTYVIDKGGVVQQVISSQLKPKRHVRESLDRLRQPVGDR